VTPPRTLIELATLERGPRSRIIVTLDRGANGERFVSIKKFILGKQGTWIVVRGVSLQLGELEGVAAALRSAMLRPPGQSP
jgi:hypothetical protein